MERGDVVRVQLPPPAGPRGSEQFGTRPAVVVQDCEQFGNVPTIVIVPLTSNQRALRFPGTFAIAPTKQNGLTADSVVLTLQIRALDKHRVEQVIGKFSVDELAQLDSKLRSLLSLL